MQRPLVPAVLLALVLCGCDSEPDKPWQPVHPREAGAGAVVLPDEPAMLARRQMRGGCSAFMVGALVDVPFGGMALLALALALIHRRRARAETALDPGAPLADGPAVIFGAVEAEPGETEPVVAVRVHQSGTETSTKNGYYHTWKESGREVSARPFFVRRDDGVRVRVEPDTRVVLHEGLLETVRHDVASRTRAAELRAGARIHVNGTLAGVGRTRSAGVYRGAAEDPVLRPPRLAPMVISTEPPGDTEAGRARFHAYGAAGLAAAFTLLSLVVVPTYQLLTIDGQRVLATPTAVRTWEVWVKPKNGSGHWVSHYAVRATAVTAAGAALSLEDECGEELYRCVGWGPCSAVPFMVAAHAPSVNQLGERPTISEGRTFGMFFLWIILGFIYPLGALSTRPWYTKRKITDTGSGHLADAP